MPPRAIVSSIFRCKSCYSVRWRWWPQFGSFSGSILKPVAQGHGPSENGVWFLRPFFSWFDRVFFRLRDLYVGLVGHSMRRKLRYVFLYVLIVAAMVTVFMRMPTGYLPDEDQGILFVQAMLPANSSLEQTVKVLDGVREHFQVGEKDAVEGVLTIAGTSFAGRGQNMALAFTLG